eukprot:gene362-683_t
MSAAPRTEKALKQVYDLVRRRLRREIRVLNTLTPSSSSNIRPDPWRFLENPNSALVKKLIRTELSWHNETLTENDDAWARYLYAEASGYLAEEPPQAPEKSGAFDYYQETGESGFGMFYRRSEISTTPELLLDIGKLAEQTEYAAVPVCKMNDSHSALAYVVDTVGDESYQLCFRSAPRSTRVRVNRANKEWNEWIFSVPLVRNMEWVSLENAKDGEHGVIYVEMCPSTKRGRKIVAARISEKEIIEKVDLAECDDEAVYMDVFKSKDAKVLFVSGNTKSTSEVKMIKLPYQFGDKPKIIRPKIPGVEYFCEHHDGYFYAMTNEYNNNFQVLTIPVDKVLSGEISNDNFTELYSPENFKIHDADMFRKGLILYGWSSAARPHICVLPLPSSVQKAVGGLSTKPTFLPLQRVKNNIDSNKIEDRNVSPISVIEPLVNADYEKSKVRFEIRSPLQPGTDYEYDISKDSLNVLREKKFSDKDFDVSKFKIDMIHAFSEDGEMIPITMVGPKQSKQNNIVSPMPMLLQVYGAYGTLLQPEFSLEHLLLLKRGWRVAFAHVRGGAEKGLEWHLSAKGPDKRHVSGRDLVDCAQFLISNNFTQADLLVAKGSSAGGTVLGWALNVNPELFAGAILNVPFLDTIGGMQDPSLPLAVLEQEEWGNVKTDYELMQSFNPFDNISESKVWPPTLFLASNHDARVPPWQAVNAAAKLRHTQNRPVESTFLRVAGSGHIGDGGSVFDSFAEACREISFMLRVVGFTHPGQSELPRESENQDIK